MTFPQPDPLPPDPTKYGYVGYNAELHETVHGTGPVVGLTRVEMVRSTMTGQRYLHRFQNVDPENAESAVTIERWIWMFDTSDARTWHALAAFCTQRAEEIEEQ